MELPISSRHLIGNKIASDDEDGGKKLSMVEKAIFLEADALQIEMGNIVGRETQNNVVIYDTAKSTQHKDRYSALAMAIHYISSLEDYRKRRIATARRNQCIGIVTKI